MPEVKQDIGLSILTSSAVFGAWSAWNSSLFTAATFVDSQEKYRNAKLAMDLGLATAVATGAGVYYVYGEKGKVASAAAIVTGLVLYAAYWCKLKSNPKINGFMASNASSPETWKPLSDEDMNKITNTIDGYTPVRVVSNP